jgi:hypothetical protein
MGQDAYCLSSVLLHPNLLVLADQALQASEDRPLQPEDMNRPDDRAILAAWRRWLVGGGSPDVRGEFYDTLDENLQCRVDSLVQYQAALPPAPEDLVQRQVVDAITKLRVRNLLRQNAELRFLQEAAEDRDTSRGYGQLTNELVTRILRLERSLNARAISGRRQNEDAAVRRLDEMLPSRE